MIRGRRLPVGIAQRKDGRYQARFTHLGKRYCIYDLSLSQVQSKMLEKKLVLCQGVNLSFKRTTLNEWFGLWMEKYKRHRIRKTTFEYCQN